MRAQAPSQAASPTFRLMSPTRNGATASGQIGPFSSWLASISAAASRVGPMPYEPICTACSLPSGPLTTAFIGAEYLVPK